MFPWNGSQGILPDLLSLSVVFTSPLSPQLHNSRLQIKISGPVCSSLPFKSRVQLICSVPWPPYPFYCDYSALVKGNRCPLWECFSRAWCGWELKNGIASESMGLTKPQPRALSAHELAFASSAPESRIPRLSLFRLWFLKHSPWHLPWLWRCFHSVRWRNPDAALRARWLWLQSRARKHALWCSDLSCAWISSAGRILVWEPTCSLCCC